MMQLGVAGKKLIKSFESCKLKSYKALPSEQYWTIGWGHYGKDVTEGMTITQAQADSMFEADIGVRVAYVNDVSNVPVSDELNQNQFDALVSLCYNAGIGSLRTLCKGRNVKEIGEALPLYNKSGGIVVNGLIRRRAAEQVLYNTPVEEDDNLKLTNYQWSIVEAQISSMLKNKLINDESWLEKAKARTLTNSELTWLVLITSKK